MFRSLLLAALVMAGSLIGIGAHRAVAQDATPAAEMEIVLPLAPDPATRCMVEPRPLAEVRAIWEEINATPSDATPIGGDVPFEAPDGTPADDATVQAITAAVVQVIACSANGNSGLHDAALVTERHLRDSNNLLGLPEEEFDGFYTETPVPSDPELWLMVYAVHDVIVLDDGRVGVRPDVIVPGVGHFQNDYLIFANEGGRWLIDFSYYGPNSYPVE